MPGISQTHFGFAFLKIESVFLFSVCSPRLVDGDVGDQPSRELFASDRRGNCHGPSFPLIAFDWRRFPASDGNTATACLLSFDLVIVIGYRTVEKSQRTGQWCAAAVIALSVVFGFFVAWGNLLHQRGSSWCGTSCLTWPLLHRHHLSIAVPFWKLQL